MTTRKQAKEQNLEKYCTGKPCKHGHTAERYVSNGVCVECHIQMLEQNKEKHRIRSLEYYHENSEKINEKKRNNYKLSHAK